MADEHKALLARPEAKPDQVETLRSFLTEALSLAEDEEKTLSWYALQIGPTTFGIFDTFEGEEGRQSHLDGEIASALLDRADELLQEPPQIERVEVLAAK
jgi:quinol monooxygenase YgiN